MGCSPHLLVHRAIQVEGDEQINILPPILLGDHDVISILFEGHRYGLTDAWQACCEVLAEDALDSAFA